MILHTTAAVLFAATAAGASTIDWVRPVDTPSVGVGNFDYVAAFDELSSFDATFTAGPLAGTDAAIVLSTATPDDVVLDLTFEVAGPAKAVGTEGGAMRFLFDPFGEFDSDVLLTLSGFGTDGEPFDFVAMNGDRRYEAVDVELVEVAPIPVPAAGLLLLTALAGLRVARRARMLI